jgi:hypothetical protein
MMTLRGFGTAAQASLTDLKGHDVYANYALTDALTFGARASPFRANADPRSSRVDRAACAGNQRLRLTGARQSLSTRQVDAQSAA